ncbi:hypothetical protein BC938DRAFT_479130 [Jimgerdemannia flammicorona]|uniref:Carboxypeptidase Taq n=1 Tax=Jimgerdemannia flammicorona TaxID=994334 RepID=A0A433QLK0_9FUNG|nr:hypothetical protein BC938DRAFT_479130 [Jimgerdemannia flammicorona]
MVNIGEIRKNYNELKDLLEELSRLSGVQNVLVWDQNVGMPNGSADARGNQVNNPTSLSNIPKTTLISRLTPVSPHLQLAVLAAIYHDKSTSPTLGAVIDRLSGSSFEGLNQYERANVRDAKRNYEHATKSTKDLEMRIARLQTKGYTTWVEAKEKNDFAMFKPILEEWVDIWEEKARLLDPTKGVYDVGFQIANRHTAPPEHQVALDQFERGLTAERVDDLFKILKEELPPLIRKIKEVGSKPDMSFLKQNFDLEQQVKFNHRLAKEIGFDTFTIDLHPTDVRITTKYTVNDIFDGISGMIHECGHAFYEQGRNKEYADLPVSSPVSLGIHESQSLFWERVQAGSLRRSRTLTNPPSPNARTQLVGLHANFWEHYLPILREYFPEQLPPDSVTPTAFWRAANAVQPGLIRIAADELTYPMHIILRYELERPLLERRITVDDLPRLWNEKMREYLGVEVPGDAQGVLQDMHWSDGTFGYFPTYTLGACYSIMWWKRMKKDIPDVDAQLREGNFTPLRQWLNENVHIKGSLYPSADELIEKVTGEPLDAHVYVEYLKNKFSSLYDLSL